MTTRLPDRDARAVPDPIAMNGLGPKTKGLKHAARVATLLVARALANAAEDARRLKARPAALLPKLVTVISVDPDVPVDGPDLENAEIDTAFDIVRLAGPGYTATLHTSRGFERLLEAVNPATRAELRAGANSSVPGVLVLLMSDAKDEGYAIGKMGNIKDVMSAGGQG